MKLKCIECEKEAEELIQPEESDNKLLYLSCEQCDLGYLPVEMVELDDDRMVYRCICGYENMLYYFRR